MSYSKNKDILTQTAEADIARANKFAEAKERILVAFFEDIEDSVRLRREIGDERFE